jgi:hypothetical protein
MSIKILIIYIPNEMIKIFMRIPECEEVFYFLHFQLNKKL